LNTPSIPEGYTSLPRAMSLLFLYQSDWKPQEFNLLNALAPFPLPDQDPVAAFTVLGRWEKNHLARRQVCVHLGHCLASEKVHSVGVSMTSGKLYWIPAAAWRLVSYNGPNRSAVPVIEAVFNGDRIHVRGKFGGTISYYPLLSSRELAIAFDAVNLPAEPALRPDGESPRATTFRPLEASSIDAPSRNPTIGQVILPQPDSTSQGKQELVKPQNRGGRPPAHDWEAFWIEVACWAAENDLQADDRPELRKHMLAWFAERSSTPPDASTVDRKLSALYAEVTRKT